jgi:hypothetical protein
MPSHKIESYTDSRGVEMPAMSFSDALRRLLALAIRNLPDEHDLARDSRLHEEKRRLKNAIYATQKLLSDNAVFLDERYLAPDNWDWDFEGYVHNRNISLIDTCSLVACIHHLKVTAEAAMPDAMSISGTQAADEFDLDQQALELASALIHMHGVILDRELSSSILNRKR